MRSIINILLVVVFGGVGAVIFLLSTYKELHIETRESVNSSIAERKSDYEKLGKQYLISYGDIMAPVHVVEFFSFQCPHCISLFRSDFETVKETLIDTGKVFFEFHPVPQDLPTAQALICFESLTESEKRLFMEVIFEEASPSDPDLMTQLMMAAMNVFKKPQPRLDDPNYLQNHRVFEEIFNFIKQEKILAVPTVEINGQLFSKEIPDYEFIISFVED